LGPGCCFDATNKQQQHASPQRTTMRSALPPSWAVPDCFRLLPLPSAPAPPAATGDADAGAVGRVRVAELDWSVPKHYSGGGEGGKGVVAGPYDYVLAADCVYHEHLVRHLYRALLALSNERTTILVANERRSESVQAAFLELFSPSFTFKKARQGMAPRWVMEWGRCSHVPTSHAAACPADAGRAIVRHTSTLSVVRILHTPTRCRAQIPLSKMAEGFSHPAIELTILKRR
jgi:hypothetical protein